jgi:DNA polymerase III alpha subunit
MKELFTVLQDRTVRFDGISVLHPEQVERFLLHGLQPRQLRVSELTQEIQDFNASVAAEDRVHVAGPEPMSFDMTWLIPEKYLKLDVEEYVLAVFGDRLPTLAYDDAQTEVAINRVAQELAEFERRGLFDLLRVIIYVLDRFKETNQVFGVGRGSSCASFILFLLGLHLVDPVLFDVPLEEFMHD